MATCPEVIYDGCGCEPKKVIHVNRTSVLISEMSCFEYDFVFKHKSYALSVMFLDTKLNSHSPSLHPGEYKNGNQQIACGQSDKLLGGNLRWTSIPSRGSRNTPSRFILQRPEISASLMGYLRFGADFTFVLSDTNLELHFGSNFY